MKELKQQLSNILLAKIKNEAFMAFLENSNEEGKEEKLASVRSSNKRMEDQIRKLREAINEIKAIKE